MDHKANWKEIEETYIELANCVCNTEVSMPCLHCDSDAFKVWYQMKYGEAAFSSTYELTNCSYYPLEGLIRVATRCEKELNLLFSISYMKKEQDWCRWHGFLRERYCMLNDTFKTVKEVVLDWRKFKAKKELEQA